MGPDQGMEGVFPQIGQLSHRFHPTVGPDGGDPVRPSDDAQSQ